MQPLLNIPLFPLHTVLFPGGVLPLKIFEPRYLGMVSQCLKQDMGFGISLIQRGKEVEKAAITYTMGTHARIIDWRSCEDGALGISVRGDRRFLIRATRVQPDQLILADVEWLPQESAKMVPRQYSPVVRLLREMLEKTGQRHNNQPPRYEDVTWVSYRFAELLPISLSQKQHLLEIIDPLQRLDRLCAMIDGIEKE